MGLGPGPARSVSKPRVAEGRDERPARHESKALKEYVVSKGASSLRSNDVLRRETQAGRGVSRQSSVTPSKCIDGENRARGAKVRKSQGECVF